jgi:uncharacterized protein YbgA (DUF1722 family)/uncharacterized protein YbbK (DUF523 family)
MKKIPKPIVVTSKCLDLAPCRYNGEVIPFDFIRRLEPHAKVVAVCPEEAIGLGTPRDPIRLVLAKNDHIRLIQPATGRGLTQEMRRFSEKFLGDLPAADGFILKSRSPSCGIRDAKRFGGPDGNRPMGKGPGLFAQSVLSKFPHVAVEDEGRLLNLTLREHFLTKLFTLARFRELQKAPTAGKLVRFQAENKLLLMAYHQTEMRQIGKLIANPGKRPPAEVATDCATHLYSALARPPRRPSNVNVLMHTLGYFSEHLQTREKAYFLDTLQKYRDGIFPLSTPLGILRAWLARYESEYLESQTYLAPFPEELVDPTDTGKGRETIRS